MQQLVAGLGHLISAFDVVLLSLMLYYYISRGKSIAHWAHFGDGVYVVFFFSAYIYSG